jgi:cation diffusion facilitator family transporter
MADQCCASAAGSAEDLNDPRWRRVLWIALGLNAAMFVVEGVAGYYAGSRALQADALDFLGDTANYAISLGVAGMALVWRSRTAMLKGVTILTFGFGVLIWAIWGLLHGSNPEPYAMSAVGALALIVNLSVALLLYRFRTGDANMRSVWICSRNDAINNCLVIGAGFAVLWTGSALPDIIVALVMASLGISGGWQIIRQARAELNEGSMSQSVELTKASK